MSMHGHRGGEGEKGKEEGDFTDGYDGMPELTEAMVFTDSYKHMECLGGMRLQFSN